jgi:putative tryptophan/tyrosine transport system substrate-binding protein
MAIHIRRREFIRLFGGAAVAWPLSARAQPDERMRRVAILMPYPPTDAAFQARVRALRQELGKLGWTAGVNVQFDERWTTDNMELVRANAVGLLELQPNVVVAVGGRVIPILMQLTRTVPIVTPGGIDPVGVGWVESLARPGGNVTGFALMEPSVFGKMLEILKQIAPDRSRVALIHNPDNPNTAFYERWFEAFARPLGVEPIISRIHGIADIDRVIEGLAQQRNGSVLFSPDLTVQALREQVVATVARHRLPAIYWERLFIESGGLISYATDIIELFRRAASYVDRILRGEKASDLPYQQPTKYDLVINLKTAKALGLEIPANLLALADEVME